MHLKEVMNSNSNSRSYYELVEKPRNLKYANKKFVKFFVGVAVDLSENNQITSNALNSTSFSSREARNTTN